MRIWMVLPNRLHRAQGQKKIPQSTQFNHKYFFPLWIRNLKPVGDFSETESERKQPIFSVPELRCEFSIYFVYLLPNDIEKILNFSISAYK